MDFLGAVNRVLVNNLVLKGDDDLITSFTETQHEASIRFARNAVTSELNNFVSFFNIPYEKASGQITTVVDQRIYTLPADFVQFWGSNPFLYLDTDHSQRCYEYPGGEDNLRSTHRQYLTDNGYETRWYWADATAKSIALFQVPDAVRVWNFDYEKDVGVSNSTDTIPLQSEQESEAFGDMASRRFKYLVNEGFDVADLEQDAEYIFARSTLMNLMRKKNPQKGYGRTYR